LTSVRREIVERSVMVSSLVVRPSGVLGAGFFEMLQHF
jgi:hypothetical protein